MGNGNRVWFFSSVLFLHFFLSTHISIGASTLSVGQSISADQSKTIVSEGNGNFELGFFTPNDNYYYVGIWYRKGEKEIVWVANRDEPLSYMDSSKLKLLEDGNLVILDPSNAVIWSTNLISTSSNSIEGALLESGNLVLRDVLNSSVLFWESFDHPTDTWLPGGKIRLNKLTNKSQRLTSWRNPMDPAPGLFSLELDPAGSNQLVILWNGSVKWWSSGIWNGNNFSLFPETISDIIFNFTYVSSQKENCFTCNLYNSSSFSKIVIDVSGELYRSTWEQPKSSKPLCCNYSCGAFANCRQQSSVWCGRLQGFHPSHALSGGCRRNTPLQCVNNSSVNGEKDRFLKMSNLMLPTNPQFLAVESAQACELACLNNCSCNAYAYGGGCSMWVGDIFSLVQLSDGDTSGQDLYLKLAASELSTATGNKKGSATGAIVGAVSGVVALFGLLVLLIWTRQRNLVGPWDANKGFLAPFSYRDLQIVTKNFSEKLGAGGFGSVFRGTLPDSTVVAVKRLEGFNQGEKQFRTEVSTVGTIQHVNLVRLHGFCCEGTRRLLVYDFMPNRSLDSHLFLEKQDPKVLDWKTRYEIALGTARGLAYLHEKCRDCIIHCDIKPENILLDAEFCPKVADFGLAKLVGRDFSRVLTTMRGTIGYLAPEWISGVAITTKADVYSYGMMLFELISGRRNSEQSDGDGVGYFPIWAASKINEDGEILSLLDYRLEGNVNLVELNRACKVASWCIQDDEIHRPSMGLVVQILEGMVEVSPPPIPRILQALVENSIST